MRESLSFEKNKSENLILRKKTKIFRVIELYFAKTMVSTDNLFRNIRHDFARIRILFHVQFYPEIIFVADFFIVDFFLENYPRFTAFAEFRLDFANHT